MQTELLKVDGIVPEKVLVTSEENRNQILLACKGVVEVKSQDQLEQAVKAMKELATITKETENARKTVKAPVLELGKKIDTVAQNFLDPVEKEMTRIQSLTTAYQVQQLREKEERDRKAREEQAKAEAAAREAEQARVAAEKAIADAKNAKDRAAAEAAKEAAELAAETAALKSEVAQEQLSIPTNTPKGMQTRVRWDFEIVDHQAFRLFAPENCFAYKDECYKIDRAGILKALNHDSAEHLWPPAEGCSEITHKTQGIRIFRDTRTHVRS